MKPYFCNIFPLKIFEKKCVLPCKEHDYTEPYNHNKSRELSRHISTFDCCLFSGVCYTKKLKKIYKIQLLSTQNENKQTQKSLSS